VDGQEFIAAPEGDDYCVAAEHALLTGDLAQAASMIAAALGKDPLEPRYHELLGRITAASRDPLELFNVRTDPFFGKAAVRAEVLAASGQLSEAMGLIGQVVTFRPALPYLTWVSRWLRETNARRIWRDELHAAGWQRLLSALGPPFEPGDPRLPNAKAALSCLAWMAQDQPREQGLQSLYIGWLKQLGRVQEALEVTRKLDAGGSSWFSQTQLGQLLRQTGQIAEGIVCFERAASMQPEEASIRLDLGDLYLEIGRAEDSIAAYRCALALEPANHWAKVSLSYLDVLQGRDESRLDLLRQLSKVDPHAHALLLDAELVSHRLGFPQSPGVEVLFDFCRRLRQSPAVPNAPHLRLALARPEPPSFHLAFHHSMQALGITDATLTLTVDDPTPVQLDREVRSRWDCSGPKPCPTLDAPPSETVAAIAAIATSDYSAASFVEQARALRIAPEQLAAAAFYPPSTRPSKVSPAGWIFRYQVAALIGLACGEQHWFGSSRRQWLYELASGHVDWVSAAAMIALGVVARDCPDALPEVKAWFTSWLVASPEDAPYGYEPYLIASFMRMPGLTGDTAALLWRRRRASRTPAEAIGNAEQLERFT
jgi:tetratricopeptide (TPR) repeat protein